MTISLDCTALLIRFYFAARMTGPPTWEEEPAVEGLPSFWALTDRGELLLEAQTTPCSGGENGASLGGSLADGAGESWPVAVLLKAPDVVAEGD